MATKPKKDWDEFDEAAFKEAKALHRQRNRSVLGKKITRLQIGARSSIHEAGKTVKRKKHWEK